MEHEVSACSARNVYDAVDKSKYDISLIRVEKFGRWKLLHSAADVKEAPGAQEPEASLPAVQSSVKGRLCKAIPG